MHREICVALVRSSFEVPKSVILKHSLGRSDAAALQLNSVWHETWGKRRNGRGIQHHHIRHCITASTQVICSPDHRNKRYQHIGKFDIIVDNVFTVQMSQTPTDLEHTLQARIRCLVGEKRRLQGITQLHDNPGTKIRNK